MAIQEAEVDLGFKLDDSVRDLLKQAKRLLREHTGDKEEDNGVRQ